MKEVIEQINTMLGNASITWQTDELLFNKMADFISNLDPDILTDMEIDKAIEIIEDLETEDEIDEIRLAKKSVVDKKQYSKRYYRKNKIKIKRNKVKFKRSAEGRKRKTFNKTHKASGVTATGRRKVKYHNRTGSSSVKR